MAKSKNPGYLKKGTILCPNDKEPLHWEQMGGMRVIKVQDGIELLQAKCVKCGWYFGVHAK
ncbi:hypothetical protein CNR34_00092 [Pseudomonas phage nickie]|uniref:Uncharacterized protein n=1 Tax=Pseudomonas phage nickie TaxID=2048977 RepID=A0A2H4P777_9CAUD|nr:hypothetical protein FDJ16_gp073 [Pseudomonas phage nickie]ATW58025.1 hypothetical protein CNR34_00092 [Pseudomonas phage nickie]